MQELHDIVAVKVVDDAHLDVRFDNGKQGIFDCRPYFSRPYWKRLADPSFFKTVRVEYGTVTWGEDIDIGEDDIYDQMFQKANGDKANGDTPLPTQV